MSKLYYGIWNNLYEISWPLRFFIEYIIFLLLMFLLLKILRWIGRKIKFNILIVKGIVVILTYIVFVFSREKDKARLKDQKIIEWGNKAIKEKFSVKRGVKYIFTVIIIGFYLIVIISDTPVMSYLDDPIRTKLGTLKTKVQSIEKNISCGYEEYDPLIVFDDSDVIQLKIRNKKEKITIYEKPEKKILAKIKKGPKIIYAKKTKKIKKKVWLKISLPDKKIVGWIDSGIVQKEQMKKILSD